MDSRRSGRRSPSWRESIKTFVGSYLARSLVAPSDGELKAPLARPYLRRLSTPGRPRGWALGRDTSATSGRPEFARNCAKCELWFATHKQTDAQTDGQTNGQRGEHGEKWRWRNGGAQSLAPTLSCGRGHRVWAASAQFKLRSIATIERQRARGKHLNGRCSFGAELAAIGAPLSLSGETKKPCLCLG